MGYFERPSPGKKAATLLTGVGLGAAIMYVLDPARGRSRRALARDKAVALANRTGRVVAKTSRDLGNRAKGVAAEIRSAAGKTREESAPERPSPMHKDPMHKDPMHKDPMHKDKEEPAREGEL